MSLSIDVPVFLLHSDARLPQGCSHVFSVWYESRESARAALEEVYTAFEQDLRRVKRVNPDLLEVEEDTLTDGVVVFGISIRQMSEFDYSHWPERPIKDKLQRTPFSEKERVWTAYWDKYGPGFVEMLIRKQDSDGRISWGVMLEIVERYHLPQRLFLQQLRKHGVLLSEIADRKLDQTTGPSPVAPGGVTADRLFYLVRRMANFCYCRYWMDARGDGTFSHVAIEALYWTADPTPQLDGDLAAAGFVKVPPADEEINARIETRRAKDPNHANHVMAGDWKPRLFTHRWEAERARDTDGQCL